MMKIFGFDIISGVIGFLLGIVGTYYVHKLTDRRREREQKEKARKNFLTTIAKMPEFIEELKSDLTEHLDVREFFVLPKGASLGGSKIPRFIYYYERDNPEDNLLNKIQILENMGYIIDVTPGNTPIFRMTEDFVDLLKRYG